MGKSVQISPLAEIFCVLAGGEIAGVPGAMVAVPLLAILHIVWQARGTGSPETHSA
jgi:predicted PurR-regulated permease PerM